MTLYTIGTTGRHDDDFIAVLKEHQIDAVIDIRLRNEGRATSSRRESTSRPYAKSTQSRTGTTRVFHQRPRCSTNTRPITTGRRTSLRTGRLSRNATWPGSGRMLQGSSSVRVCCAPRRQRSSVIAGCWGKHWPGRPDVWFNICNSHLKEAPIC